VTTHNWIGRSPGAALSVTSGGGFDGMIDDFRIYKRVLSAAEIAALP
jgi:hypothetical protein